MAGFATGVYGNSDWDSSHSGANPDDFVATLTPETIMYAQWETLACGIGLASSTPEKVLVSPLLKMGSAASGPETETSRNSR